MGNTNSNTLGDTVIDILIDAGFDDESYIFIDKGEEVFVDFDDKGSADYLIKIAEEPKWKNNVAASYTRAGKRHRVLFFLW